MHTMHGIEPHIMVIGMPQAIIRFIMSQQLLSMSMLIMPLGIIMHIMPLAVISNFIIGIIGMPQQLIIGMPLQIIPHGVPLAIISFIIRHMERIISMEVPSAGSIMQSMPWSFMEQSIWHIIGIMPATGMFIPMPIVGICIGMFIIGIVIAVFMVKAPWQFRMRIALRAT